MYVHVHCEGADKSENPIKTNVRIFVILEAWKQRTCVVVRVGGIMVFGARREGEYEDSSAKYNVNDKQEYNIKQRGECEDNSECECGSKRGGGTHPHTEAVLFF